MEAHLQSLIEFFAAHAGLALGCVFAASFLEALALIGTVIPGSSIVFAAGILVGLRVLDPWLASGLAVAGAILGDAASYGLGRRYRDTIRGMWPMRSYPGLFARGEAYFAAHGGKSVFLGRFLGPVRAIVPVIAGMSGMPRPRFFVMNVLSAFGWAAVHLVPGVLFGASLQIAGAMSSRLALFVALIVAGLWLIVQVVRLAFRFGVPYVEALQRRLIARAGAASGPIERVMLPLFDPARREPVALLVSATLLVGGTWLFLGVVEDVVTKDTLVSVDRAIYLWLQALRTRIGDDIMVTVSELGSAYVTIAVLAGVGIWFAVTRRFRTLGYWLAAASFAELMVFALKNALGRARPPTAYALVDEFSLPSGHAALSMVVYGFLAFLLGNRRPGWQQMVYAVAAACIAMLVAFSRLYLGAHWFSDVIASFGLGIAWIALLGIAYILHVRERTLHPAPVLLIVLATLMFIGGSYAGTHHERDLARYAKPAMVPTLRLADWKDGEWRDLPAARSDIRGEVQEAFSLQWAAPRDEIARALLGAGWQRPARWRSSATLLWLLPSTPIADLPVLPRFNQGQPPALTLIRPVDARTRTVIRLWYAANAAEGDAAAHDVPIYVGMVTTERSHPEFKLVATVRTLPDQRAAAKVLSDVVREAHTAIEVRRANGGNVLLVW